MYPQPYASLYSQHSYSSNPFFLSFPQPTLPPALSDSALHHPGADPLGNPGLYLSDPSAYGGQTINYQDLNANAQNWIVKQVRPIRYEAPVETSYGTSAMSTSLHSPCNDTGAQQLLPNDTPAVLPNQTKVDKPMHCEVCKIDCNSKHVFEKHISGKKHRKNFQLQNNPTKTTLSGNSQASLQIQLSSVEGQELFGAVGKELESKKQKLLSGGAAVDSVRVCTICNIACNSQEVFSKHLTGQKHAAQVGLISNNGIGPYLAAFKRHGIGPWAKVPKKIKVAQPSWCEVCKINCNSKDVYIIHLSGKKHLRNMEKLSKSKNNDADAAGTTAVTVTANDLRFATNPVIGPQEKPDTYKHEGTNSHKPQKAVMLEAENDIETKKRKLVEGGAAAAAVKLCTICNVVCNSQTVFNSHLAGQKHAAMVKKQAESTTS